MLSRGKISSSSYTLGDPVVLERDDLVLLKTPRAAKPVIQRLRDPHHLLARLLASGVRLGEAAERSGYSLSRASVLQSDPAFKDLIEQYRKEVSAAYSENLDTFFSLATSNMLKAQRQLAEKLEEADETGELLSVRELVAISADSADRVGYGKKQTNVNVNVDFASQLEKAIARSSKAEQMKVVGQVSSRAQLPSPAPDTAPRSTPSLASAPIRRRA